MYDEKCTHSDNLDWISIFFYHYKRCISKLKVCRIWVCAVWISPMMKGAWLNGYTSWLLSMAACMVNILAEAFLTLCFVVLLVSCKAVRCCNLCTWIIHILIPWPRSAQPCLCLWMRLDCTLLLFQCVNQWEPTFQQSIQLSISTNLLYL